ncbi:MAG: MBL fold metallo-hydrolase [Candidatus Eremiobacteraeota bacterium]|nr:MBL fold metallo-hydrolase [Candidatus Eremiobacteraeota bacterium]
MLVDCGGGTFERIGQAGLDLSGLEQVLLTHLHIDHTSDLPAVIMHLYMSDRGRALTVTGPRGRPGNTDAPENAAPQLGVSEFVRLLFGVEGAWRYMNTFDGFAINATDVASVASGAVVQSVHVDPALIAEGISIDACGVPHGMMPTLAFRINYRGRSVVFSGDTSGATPALLALASQCSMLVHDFALPEREVPSGKLHAKPSVVGWIANESGTKSLLLSHFMPAIEPELDTAVDIVRRAYTGKIELAEDLSTYEVG